MHWRDKGVLLSVRSHGETSAIIDVLTEAHGRHSGLVRGGTSRRYRGILQPGNTLSVEWRGRLESHLGTYVVDMETSRTGHVIGDPFALKGLSSACALAAACLPEREVHARVLDGLEVLLDALEDPDVWPAVYVRWELGLLQDLGFGLDLTKCASTGVVDDLVYVSPKSGRAVSREAGAPYKDRLLALPGFLLGRQSGEVTAQAVCDGVRLTGHFIERYLLAPDGRRLPQARERLLEALDKQLAQGVDRAGENHSF